jgi:protein involved in polysaccharide export with SLBB domain
MPFDIPDRRTSPRRAASACVVLLLLARPGAAQQQQAQCGDPRPASSRAVDTTSAGGRRLGTLHPGDLIKLNVFRSKEFSSDYIIDSEGRLVIPGLGALAAAGIEQRELENNVRELLACRGIVPDVSLQTQIRVSVTGEVRNPAVYPAEPGISVLRLLTMAGGATPTADLSKTIVIREGRTYHVDLNRALNGDASGSVILNSNDVVVVPKKSGFSRNDLNFVLGIAGVVLSAANVLVTLSRH